MAIISASTPRKPACAAKRSATSPRPSPTSPSSAPPTTSTKHSARKTGDSVYIVIHASMCNQYRPRKLLEHLTDLPRIARFFREGVHPFPPGEFDRHRQHGSLPPAPVPP